MSIAIRPPRPKKKPAVPTTSPTPRSARRIHYAEAPDRGVLNQEAPEGRACREAPDAGEGRASFTESVFTHGRSQS